MDWLTQNDDGVGHIRVPCLVRNYAVLEFNETKDFVFYPETNGRDRNHFRSTVDHTYGGKYTLQEAAEFLQAWIFFGTLCWVTSLPIKARDYVKVNEDGSPEITLVKLGDLLAAWQVRLSTLSSAEIEKEGVLLDKYFDFLRSTYQTILDDNQDGAASHRSPLAPEVRLSIIILNKVLVSTKCFLYPKAQFEPQEWLYGEAKLLLQRKLEINGWCPHEYKRLEQNLSSVGLFYLAALGSRGIERDHRFCDAKLFPKPRYAPKHINPDCQCEMHGVDPQILVKMIQRGDVPLMTWDTDPETGKKGCRLSSKTSDIVYVATSHVCSEGLGNMDENKLPACQLEKLQGNINALYQRPEESGSTNQPPPAMPIPFWIDTLCVPLSTFNSKARDHAIASMAQIYRDADKVIVLDAELMAMSNKPSYIQRATFLGNCIWWTRLWTLQEGFLPKRLYFQFQEECVSGECHWRIWDSLQQMERAETATKLGVTPSSLRARILLKEAFSGFLSLWKCKNAPKDEQAGYLWGGLTPRSTSSPEDEALCLATVFGVDVLEIVKFPIRERMPALVKLQKTYPSRFIFWSKYLEQFTASEESTPEWYEWTGFRWSPESFLLGRIGIATGRDYHKANNPSETLGIATPQGLVVNYPGLRIDIQKHSAIGKKLWVRETSSQDWYSFHNVTCFDRFVQSHRQNTCPGPVVPYCLILPRVPTEEGFGDRVMISVLAKIETVTSSESEHGGRNVICSSPLCRVLTVWYGKLSQEELTRRIAADGVRIEDAIPGVWQHRDTLWCVG